MRWFRWRAARAIRFAMLRAPTFAAVRARITDPQLIAQLEGEAERDERTLGRIFGEDLPSGLVLTA